MLILATPKKRGSTSNSSNSDPDSLSPNKMYDKRKSDKDKKSVDVSGMYKFCFKISSSVIFKLIVLLRVYSYLHVQAQIMIIIRLKSDPSLQNMSVLEKTK